jgi:hypothetical protein
MAIIKDIYRDGRAWRYRAGSVYAYGGTPVTNVARGANIIPKGVARIAFTVSAVDVNARIQVSQSPRDVLALGGGSWADCGAGSTLGTGTKTTHLPANDLTGFRLFIDAAGLAGGSAVAAVEMFTDDAVKGEAIFTPEGGEARLFSFAAVAGVSKFGTLLAVGSSANSVDVSAINATEFAGVMYSDGIPYGGTVLVTIKGMASVLLENGKAGVAGQQVISSTAATGRSDCIATPAPYTAPALAVRFGHCVTSVALGVDVLARIKLL